MIERIQVIGAGRVGSAFSARLRERGLSLDDPDPELVLICVPDRAIADVAREVPRGPWIGHVSGATPLRALNPHVLRFGLHPFVLDDDRRGAYHAGAAIASNYLVTLRRAAGLLLESAGAPPEALDPLMQRTIENEFELTGPIERGDWETVGMHLDAIRTRHPELEDLYRVLADLTTRQLDRPDYGLTHGSGVRA